MVGHNLLEGKVVTLSKPLAVMRKKSLSTSQPTLQSKYNMDIDGTDEGARTVDDDDDEKGAGVEYDVVALVTKKLLFSKRPMPVVKMSEPQA